MRVSGEAAAGGDAEGWLLEPEQESLQRAMQEVVRDPASARAKGQLASTYVREQLTWEHAAKLVLERLEALQNVPIRRETSTTASVTPNREDGEKPRSVRERSGGKAKPDICLVVYPFDGEADRKAASVSLDRYSPAEVRREALELQSGSPAALLNGWLVKSDAEWLVVVREDVVLTEGWLDRLMRHSEQDNAIATLVPRLPHGPQPQRAKARYRSLKKELARFASRMAQRETGVAQPVDALSHACVALKVEAVRAVGGFDESFGTWAFLEDYVRRSRQLGLVAACATDTFVHCEPDTDVDGPPDGELQAALEMAAGDAHRTAGRAEEAIACYRGALETKPDYLEATLVLATSLLELGRGEEAVGLFEELEARHPDSSRIKNYLGRCLFQSGRRDEARANFEASLALDQAFPEAHSNLGVLLWEAGELDGALEQLKTAAELSPDHPDVIYNVAMVYAQLGQTERAADALERYVVSSPDDLQARVHLAVLHLESGAEAEGLSQLEAVLEAEPDHEEATKVVAQLQRAVDAGAEAEDAAEGEGGV